MTKRDRLWKHGRFWVAALSGVAALVAILLRKSESLGLLHEAWDEFAVLAGVVYALFALRREVRDRNR